MCVCVCVCVQRKKERKRESELVFIRKSNVVLPTQHLNKKTDQHLCLFNSIFNITQPFIIEYFASKRRLDAGDILLFTACSIFFFLRSVNTN